MSWKQLGGGSSWAVEAAGRCILSICILYFYIYFRSLLPWAWAEHGEVPTVEDKEKADTD